MRIELGTYEREEREDVKKEREEKRKMVTPHPRVCHQLHADEMMMKLRMRRMCVWMKKKKKKRKRRRKKRRKKRRKRKRKKSELYEDDLPPECLIILYSFNIKLCYGDIYVYFCVFVYMKYMSGSVCGCGCISMRI